MMTMQELCTYGDDDVALHNVLVFSSSRLAVGTEVSVRADSSLPVRSAHGLDPSAVPGSSRTALLQDRAETTEPLPVPQGPPKETLESILVALDTEKYVLSPPVS